MELIGLIVVAVGSYLLGKRPGATVVEKLKSLRPGL